VDHVPTHELPCGGDSQDFQNRYFGPSEEAKQHYKGPGAFPEIKEWHRWVAGEIQTKAQLTTYMGRRRQFYGQDRGRGYDP
jgi:hypothetical protein